jgi:hypothetical protein
MTLPDGRLGTSLAAGLLVLFLAFCYFAVVRPLRELYVERAAALEEKRDRLEHLERAAADLPGLRASLADLRSAAKNTDLLLSGPSDTVAAANLQSRMKELVAQAGGETSSAESLPPSPRGGFRRVGVRATMAGDLETLASLLHAIHIARPPLFVEDLELHVDAIAALKAPEKSPPLKIVVGVYGFRGGASQTSETQ